MKLKNTKLREGDEVIVISGKEKGKRGNIKQIIGSKCVINDLNLAKRHTRPNPQLGITGGIVEKEMSINLSNVMIWNSSAKKEIELDSSWMAQKRQEYLNQQAKKLSNEFKR